MTKRVLEQRGVKLSFRMTSEEHRAIQGASEGAGLGVSEWVRRVLGEATVLSRGRAVAADSEGGGVK